MPTILCIDDDRNILGIQEALFGSKGHTVLTAPDGISGVALTRQHSIDIVVLDFNMPTTDGNQVAQVLTREQPNLHVVIWSGCPDEIPEPLRWFADALLHKGDGPNALLAAIEKLVSAPACGPPARIIRRSSIECRSPLLRGRLRESKPRS